MDRFGNVRGRVGESVRCVCTVRYGKAGWFGGMESDRIEDWLRTGVRTGLYCILSVCLTSNELDKGEGEGETYVSSCKDTKEI